MAILVVAVFIVRLFYLQIVDRTARDKAENISLVKQTVYPPRGLVYDRNGNLLIYNDAVYDLMIIPRQAKDIDTA